MAYYYYPGVPEHLPQADKDLIEKACRQHWTEINPEIASTEEARKIMRVIENQKFHLEECRDEAREERYEREEE